MRRPRSNVRSLLDISLALIVELVDDVESLQGLPDVVKTRIAAAVCASRRLGAATFRLFGEAGPEGGPTELVVPDCAAIDPDAMLATLCDAIAPRYVSRQLARRC